MTDPVPSSTPNWPQGGVVRVAFEPGKLPALGDKPGTNRFDDPRPRTIDRFLIRYAASTLRGCLLELLTSFRPNGEAEERIAAIDIHDPDLVEAPSMPVWQPLRDYLADRKVATINAAKPAVVSVNDAATQQALDREPAVRAVLDSDQARTVLLGGPLEGRGTRVHLDNAAIRLSGPLGRAITQACALALWDRDPPPDVVHYRSRHDDHEDCWAIYGHAEIEILDPTKLAPTNNEHVAAVTMVATLWDLPLPPEWRRAASRRPVGEAESS